MQKAVSKTKGKKLELSLRHRFEQFAQRVNNLGANLAVCDSQGNTLFLSECRTFTSSRKELKKVVAKAVHKHTRRTEKTEQNSNSNIYRMHKVIAAVLDNELVVLIDSAKPPTGEPQDEMSIDRTYEALAELLDIFVDKVCCESQCSSQLELVSTELAGVYEQLVLLHKLSTNMSVTHTDNKFLQMACDSLTDIVSVEGIALLLEKTVNSHISLNLAAGSGLIDFDEHISAILHDRLMDEIESGKEALLDSAVDTPFKYHWPDSIKSLIALPLTTKQISETDNTEQMNKTGKVIGMLVAVNRLDKPDFDSTDVKLFNSVASGCAVFLQNGRLFREIQELFLGSLRALTNGIDAKDKYTRGHSERVAFISKWIADELAADGLLETEEVPRIYLAGLLHDIGKMGVSEAVLRKEGKLTKYEMDCIKTHPSIGAGILNEIKQIRKIVPGVLYHHERVDGKGYPNGLKGEQIPLVGKIIGLADAFDAMTSKRSYRDAMTIEHALEEVRKGLGNQFDEKVGKAFLNSDIARLWEIMQEGMSGVYESGALSDFATLAGGALVT